MGTFVFILLLGVGGILAAVFYTFIIGLAGAPGALLSVAAAKHSPNGVTPLWGLFLTVVGQLYVSLVFVAFIINFVEARLVGITGPGKWITWCIAFFVAVAPSAIALKDAARAERRNIQHHASTFTAPLTVLGFFLFWFFPKFMAAGWGWIPQL